MDLRLSRFAVALDLPIVSVFFGMSSFIAVNFGVFSLSGELLVGVIASRVLSVGDVTEGGGVVTAEVGVISPLPFLSTMLLKKFLEMFYR